MVEKYICSEKIPLIRAFCVKFSVYPGLMNTDEKCTTLTNKIKYPIRKIGNQVLI
jgi:hypothetical protein